MYDFGILEKDVQVAGRGGQIIEGKKVIIREDTNIPLAIVSKRYNVVKHEDIVQQFESALDTIGGKFKNRTVKTWLPHNGAKMFRKYTFNDVALEFRQGDLIKLTLELLNSYDGTMRGGYNLGAYRLVCTNGLVVGTKFQAILSKHFGSFDLKGLAERLQNSIPTFEQVMGNWKEWTGISVTPEQAQETFKNAVLPEQTKVAIYERFLQHEEHTKWGLFQAATWVTSHKFEAKKQENTRLSRYTAEGVLIPIFYGKKKIGG